MGLVLQISCRMDNNISPGKIRILGLTVGLQACRLSERLSIFPSNQPFRRQTRVRFRNAKLTTMSGRGDEMHVALTADGWALPLYRYRPRFVDRDSIPVVLVHGMGANRYTFTENGQTNFARWLADRGHDVFVVELRGAGNSTVLTPTASKSTAWVYDFDTYLEQDTPALLAKIKEVTGSHQVDWVGHSMGGMLLYALAGAGGGESGGVRIRRGVTLASPAVLEKLPPRMATMLQVARLLPWRQLPNRLWLQFASSVNPFAISTEDVSLGFAHNYHPKFVREFIRKVGADLSSSLLNQVRDWLGRDGLYNRDGSINYTASLSQSRLPIKLIGAVHDRIAPPQSVEAAFLSGGVEQEFILVGRDRGFANDYGHTDILVGRNAPDEIYPLVSSWLAKNNSKHSASA